MPCARQNFLGDLSQLLEINPSAFLQLPKRFVPMTYALKKKFPAVHTKLGQHRKKTTKSYETLIFLGFITIRSN